MPANLGASAAVIKGALADSILGAWRTNCQATELLVGHLPAPIWNERIPGAPFKTIRMLAAHLSNSRVRWTRTLGREHGITAPALVDPRRVTRSQLVTALRGSGKGIEALLRLGIAAGGQIPPSVGYVWRNLPLDVGHVLAYFVTHEGHHRGQLLLIARQLDHRVPRAIDNGLWQWSSFVRKRGKGRQRA